MIALRAVRRDDRDDLGADREGGPAAGRRARCWRCWCCALRLQPARAVRGGGGRSYGDGVLAPGKLVAKPARRHLAGHGAHVRHRRAAAHPDALLHRARCAAARTSVFYATGLIGFFYLLTFMLGFGAMVLVGPRRDHGGGQGRQHGGAAAGRAARRHAVPRLHRGGGVRDHSRGGGRPHALGRGRAVARPLGQRGAQAARPMPDEQLRVARGSRPWRWASSPWCSGITFKGQNVAFMVSLAFAIAASAQLPRAGAVDLLARLHHRRRRGEHGDRHGGDAAC